MGRQDVHAVYVPECKIDFKAEAKRLKPIMDKELDYDELMAYSLKYSDAVITYEPGVSNAVLEAAASLPKLDFVDDDDVNKVTQFYSSLFD